MENYQSPKQIEAALKEENARLIKENAKLIKEVQDLKMDSLQDLGR